MIYLPYPPESLDNFIINHLPVASLAQAVTYDRLVADIENVNQIDIVPTMLDVICRTTGMGFAAIARVTEDRWIACSVKDELAFGLLPGGELKVETTICNEIRDSRQPVIIDNVAEDEHYSNHHTPKIYGIQSYISFPIILKTGEFFGTLCAIDPKPHELNNPKVIGLFSLFSELIAFHLQKMDLIDQSRSASRHQADNHLQEPLRRIDMLTESLIRSAEQADVEQAKGIASELRSCAQELSTMIGDRSDPAVNE